jgi:hypothetical protein
MPSRTQEDLEKLEKLEKLEEAILTGAQTVMWKGKSITYRSLDQMIRIRNMVRKELGLTKKSARIYTKYDDGLDS